jgi:2-desacetyl-2-hydroxyethyl bacteriochlorophyllide A dehydrogenase
MNNKSLVCTEPGSFKYVEEQLIVDNHHRHEDDSPARALLRVLQVGICGTDLHAFEGTQPYFQYPRILGHEICAEIIEVPAGTGFRAGQQVTLVPYFSCGTCIACRNNKPNCCTSIQVFGVHIDGGLRHYIEVPVAALIAGEDLNADQLALTEPLAIGAHAVRRADLRPDEWALIMGAGPIGLGLMEMARLRGARVIALDINSTRLQFCREQLGVEHCINPAELKDGSGINDVLRDLTAGDMPTAVFDATGYLGAIEKGIDYLAHGGRYTLVGLQKQPIPILHPEFHKREATLMSSRNATRDDFLWVMESLRNNKIRPSAYITHRLAFEDLADQFPALLDPANGVIKAMVEFRL